MYAYPYDRINNEYKYPTAYKFLYYPVLYQEICLETGKIIPVLYKTIIASPILY
jgi:hypothetical protein